MLTLCQGARFPSERHEGELNRGGGCNLQRENSCSQQLYAQKQNLSLMHMIPSAPSLSMVKIRGSSMEGSPKCNILPNSMSWFVCKGAHLHQRSGFDILGAYFVIQFKLRK